MGEIVMWESDLDDPNYVKSGIEVAKRMTEMLHLCLKGNNPYSFGIHDQLTKFVTQLEQPSYVSRIYNSYFRHLPGIIENFPQMSFCYRYMVNEHLVYYRPTLLDGRHIVDVLIAVLGPAEDITEEELEWFREEATEESDLLGGVWRTSWSYLEVFVKYLKDRFH